jgi:hypothetical protein
MRILVALVVVLVFGALMLFDTAALIRLTAYCVTGNCGVRPTWIAAALGAIALAVAWSYWRGGGTAKPKKKGPARTARAKSGSGKTAAKKKPKQPKAPKVRSVDDPGVLPSLPVPGPKRARRARSRTEVES